MDRQVMPVDSDHMRRNRGKSGDGSRSPSSLERLLTVSEAASVLNMSCDAMYLAVERGEVPHLRLSPHRIRFRPSELEKWLSSKSIKVKE